MSQPSTRNSLRRLALLGVGIASLSPALPALAVEVRGVVSLPPPAAVEASLGYTRTRVAAQSTAGKTQRAEAAVFLKVKESLPLPAPSAKWPLKLAGLRLEPSVMVCAVDEQIEITNADKTAATVVIGNETLQQIAPGGTLTFLCQHGGAHAVRVQEWPHMRGTLFVGEVGVSGMPKEDGRFSLSAPQGTYELTVIGADGPVTSVPVTVVKSDVDLGTIPAPSADAKTPTAVEPPPAPKPAVPPPPAPAAPPKPKAAPEAKAKAPAVAKPEAAAEDVFELEP